jgi:hypothetical protein
MKIILFLLILFAGYNNLFCQLPASKNEKTDSADYKARLKFNFVASYFVAKELDKKKIEKENFIKYYAIQFFLDSNLNSSDFFVRGEIAPELMVGLKNAIIETTDSLKRRSTDMSKLKAKIVYIPLIYVNRPDESKPAVAVLSESDVFSIFSMPNACPPHTAGYFYMPENFIILNPLTYNNPPLMNNWGKVKFIKKTGDDD